MPKLFSYGTLQKEQVQLETFGRRLSGTKDMLTGYVLKSLRITDPEVLRKSEQEFHPILELTNNPADIVEGILFEVSQEELQSADAYEVANYKRMLVIFASGEEGYVYVQK
jgi:hypothetical protein